MDYAPTGITIHQWPNPPPPSTLAASCPSESSYRRDTWRASGELRRGGAVLEPQEGEVGRVPQSLGDRSRPAIAEPVEPARAPRLTGKRSSKARSREGETRKKEVERKRGEERRRGDDII